MVLRRAASAWLAIQSLIAAAPAAAAPPPPFAVERVIPLAGTGRIDHMAFDARRGRLFVAELGAGAVEAVDVGDGRSLARRTGFAEPQGLAWLPRLDQIAVAGGGDGTVRFLRSGDLAEVGRVRLDSDADDLRTDAAGQVIAAHGRGGLAVIDATSRRVVAEIAIGAHPEGFALDEARRRAVVNVPEKMTAVVVDLTGGTVATWRLAPRLGNFPLAIDGGLAVIAFRLPASLALYRLADGRQTGAASACADADDIWIDRRRGRIYVSCGAGEVQVFGVAGGAPRGIGRVATRRGARTSLYSPETDRLYAAAPAGAGRGAAILVLRPVP